MDMIIVKISQPYEVMVQDWINFQQIGPICDKIISYTFMSDDYLKWNKQCFAKYEQSTCYMSYIIKKFSNHSNKINESQ